ncbi:MAG: LptF/LptG family permease [Planctomycetota bacterium]
MKILDKYVARNFLVGYVISLFVLIGLRIIIDLFVNLDEFTEHAGLGTWGVIYNISNYYGTHCLLYFREFAGIITVIAAVFSLGKMTRSNELVAVIASGVSLKRVIAPIILLAVLLTGILVIDQEFLIPPLADKLVRGQDALPGQESYDVWFLIDGKGSLICSRRFDVKTSTLEEPTIITRQKIPGTLVWKVTGQISASQAVYNTKTNRWDLTDGLYLKRTRLGQNPEKLSLSSYESDIVPKDIPVLRKARHKSLLGSKQLAELAAKKTGIKDLAQLYSQKHFRITEPLINLVMLMVSLPILVCREPKALKSAILISFATTTGCLIVTFICKTIAAEAFLQRIIPEFWAWLPVFIFLPIAIIELDAMKT